MMEYGGSGLIGFLFKAFEIVLFSGIIILPFIPLKIKPVISVVSDYLVDLITRLIIVFQFIQNRRIQEYVNYGTVFIQVMFIGTVLKFWH
jgi:hypothetical protein